MIAALYVQPDGVYAGLPDVDLWPEERDARRYDGPWLVVAHPPCRRWCRMAPVNQARYGQPIGEDEGCFAAALAAVRRFGGVLEHPAQSLAWQRHGLPWPPRTGGWQMDLHGGWCCYVEQGHYGHIARKGTWLYAVNTELPELRWGPYRGATAWISADRPRAALNAMGIAQVNRRQANATPLAFRDLLLSIVTNRCIAGPVS